MRMLSSAAVAGGCAIIALAAIAAALETRGSDATPIEVLSYRPVTSDLMNAYVQPRHIKLFLAGSVQNWAYAEYERHNIGGALGRLAVAVPQYQGQSMEGLIATFATPQLAALDAAIRAKDEAAFRTAYEGLTTGCNQCHQATGHGMVVLQSPATDPFPDQVFRAPDG